MQWIWPKYRIWWVFFLGLLILNFWQAHYTEILHDEAYYWMYAQRIDWGYFDHPPMIAWLIRLGSVFFSHELGVRFMTVLLGGMTILLLWQLVFEFVKTDKQVVLFFVLIMSVPLFQAYEFISAPDGPLLFFTVLFFYAYRAFAANDSWTSAIVLSISMIGLVYSKYQGGILIILVIISNLRLLLNVRFITISIMALVFFMPHILWQIEHEFPSFQYHLIARSKPFKWAYFFEFWPNQIASFNPVFLGFGLFAFFNQKLVSLFQRALLFTIVGFFLFFWLMTFRGHVEPQWTIIAFIPLFVFIMQRMADFPVFYKRLYMYSILFVLLILLARILMVFQVLPMHLEFYGQKEWTKKLQFIAQDRPVAFINSYQRASVYKFYTGKPAFSMNNITYRKNQFDLWKEELNYWNQEVMTVDVFPFESSKELTFDKSRPVYYCLKDSFISVQRMQIEVLQEKVLDTLVRGQKVQHSLLVNNLNRHSINLENHHFPVSLHIIIQNQASFIIQPVQIISPTIDSIPVGKFKLEVSWILPEELKPHESYQLLFSFRTGLFAETFHSKGFSFYVKN